MLQESPRFQTDHVMQMARYMARFITFKLAFTHVNIIRIYTYINECKQFLGIYI